MINNLLENLIELKYYNCNLCYNMHAYNVIVRTLYLLPYYNDVYIVYWRYYIVYELYII